MSTTKKSKVWMFFKDSEEESKAECTICNALISRGGKGKSATTSSLINHIKEALQREFNSESSSSDDRDNDEELTSTSGINRSHDFLCKPPILQSRPYSNLDEKTDESSTLSPPSFASYAAHYDDCLVSKTSCGSMFSHPYRKQRGEKKPIPADQKDEKYYERRRRNNQAAKKSRDARKQREDQIALRATILEHENALLKAQLLTVREEASSLRQLLLEKKSIEFSLK
nr:hepatic leukemia factor-like [Onthophagus taurus]